MSPLVKKFKEEVYDRAKEIDPENERDWFDMAYGYFLGNGVDRDTAFDLALESTNRCW